MKVIFLDFDGVLNSSQWFMTNQELIRAQSTLLTRHAAELDPTLVRRMRDFANEVAAVVVISSSWRILHTLDELKFFLSENDWPNAPVIDKTPRYRSGFRGEEVNEWLRDNSAKLGVTHHVIFDDDRDFHDVQPLVLTSWHTGVTDAHIEAARKYMK